MELSQDDLEKLGLIAPQQRQVDLAPELVGCRAPFWARPLLKLLGRPRRSERWELRPTVRIDR